jgi:hypothetical protein
MVMKLKNQRSGPKGAVEPVKKKETKVYPCTPCFSLRTETVKYGRKSQETRTRERLRWQGPAAHTKDRPALS